MTPQESELVDELFNRLVKLETAQRDPEAERLIADGLRRAPHAVYAHDYDKAPFRIPCESN